MVVTKRKFSPGKLSRNTSDMNRHGENTPPKTAGAFIPSTTAKMDKMSKAIVTTPIILLFLWLSFCGVYSDPSSSSPRTWQIVGRHYKLHIDAKRNEGQIEYALGVHQVTVHTNLDKNVNCKNKNKPNVPIHVSIVGDALVDVPLVEERPNVWVGSFEVPMDGSYQIESTWDECGSPDIGLKETKLYKFKAVGQSLAHDTITNADTGTTDSGNTEREGYKELFSNSAWIASDKLSEINPQLNLVPGKYVWANLEMAINGKPMRALKVLNNSTVFEESVVTKKYGYQSFQSLSNYEIVCWIGGEEESASKSWSTFLQLRPQIFSSQRPFKFHHYPATNFVNPAMDWEKKKLRQQGPYGTFRKCKHIFISFDNPEPDASLEAKSKARLSQKEYRDQVETFIKHLLNAFNEEHTFPSLIWMMTVNQSFSQQCHSPYLKKTTNHPCNDALKDLLDPKSSPFPERVRLMDNTDLSMPMSMTRSDEIHGAIALRIYALVGHQVKIWRDAGMIGGINGLSVKGVTTPNYKLERYDWSQDLARTGTTESSANAAKL